MASLDPAGIITRMCTDLKEKFASKSVETSKQDKLVSGTNIKTVNGTSLLGSGNVGVQPTLVSGTNIKTVNGASILGSGNIQISGSGTIDAALSDTSANAVQNKVIKAALEALIAVETLYDSSTITVKRSGRMIMVQAHGVSVTPSTSTPVLANVLTDYKPAYNISTPVLTSSGGSTQVARMVVYTSDGGVYIVPAGYQSSASWYGTLTYIY